MIIISYAVGDMHARKYVGPPQLKEFDVPDQLAEVKLLQAKYSSDIQAGFSRSDEKTIQFHYLIARSVDTDGDGYKETPRHLELTLTCDESGGTIDKNPDAKILGEKIQCTEPSPSDIRTFVDVVPPAEDGKIMDFIQNVKCVF